MDQHDTRHGVGNEVNHDTASPRGRRDLRTAAQDVARHWDELSRKVPAPLLRVLVTLPWLARRMPVPFWVPLAFMLGRRVLRHYARKSDRRRAQRAAELGE
jgi:hypothetical protein